MTIGDDYAKAILEAVEGCTSPFLPTRKYVIGKVRTVFPDFDINAYRAARYVLLNYGYLERNNSNGSPYRLTEKGVKNIARVSTRPTRS